MNKEISFRIESKIFVIRGHKVMLDADLALLYGVSTGRFNEQVRRNKERFPKEFMFQLTKEEFENLKSQFAISTSHGGRRKLPWAFTEHGAIMAATLLNSPRAVATSVYVVRAFVKLRQMAFSLQDLTSKLNSLEKKYDAQFQVVFKAIRELMTPPDPPRRRIGFHQEE